MPNTTRLEPLRAWLDRVNAQCLYEMTSPSKRILTSVYVIGGRVAIVQSHRNMDGTTTGWDLFVPAKPDSADIALTLDAAAIALGVEGCAGLVPAPISKETEERSYRR